MFCFSIGIIYFAWMTQNCQKKLGAYGDARVMVVSPYCTHART